MFSERIENISKDLETKTIGEATLTLLKKQSYEETKTMMFDAHKRLPEEIQSEFLDLLDNFMLLGQKKEFWSEDCGKVFKILIMMSTEFFSERGVQCPEENLIDLFIVVSSNFVGNAHEQPEMKKFIKKSTNKGLFGWFK